MNAKGWLKNNIGYLIIAVLSFAYIFTALLTLQATGKTIDEIITDSAVLFVLGISVNRLFEMQGFLNGYRDDGYMATKRLHGQTVLKIAPFINQLDKWCDRMNEDNLVNQRTKILASVGLKYDDYFGDEPKEFIPDEEAIKNKWKRKGEMMKRRAYLKALKLKLTPLTSTSLTSDDNRPEDQYDMGETRAGWERKSAMKNIVTKAFCSVALGMVGIGLIQDFSWQALVWTTVKMTTILTVGVTSMYRAYLFITDEYRCNIVKKINELQKFESDIKGVTQSNGDQEKEPIGTSIS